MSSWPVGLQDTCCWSARFTAFPEAARFFYRKEAKAHEVTRPRPRCPVSGQCAEYGEGRGRAECLLLALVQRRLAGEAASDSGITGCKGSSGRFEKHPGREKLVKLEDAGMGTSLPTQGSESHQGPWKGQGLGHPPCFPVGKLRPQEAKTHPPLSFEPGGLWALLLLGMLGGRGVARYGLRQDSGGALPACIRKEEAAQGACGWARDPPPRDFLFLSGQV